jgi:hypothetical protein
LQERVRAVLRDLLGDAVAAGAAADGATIKDVPVPVPN